MAWFRARRHHGEAYESSDVASGGADGSASVLPPPPPWAPSAETAESEGRLARLKPPTWLARTLVVVGVVALAFVATVAVYDRVQSDMLMPGASIDGVDVGGMSTADAVDMLSSRLDQAQEVELTLTADGETMAVSLADLGLHADVQGAVDQAHNGTSDQGIMAVLSGPFTRSYHRLLDKPVDLDIELDYAFSEEQLRGHVDTLAAQVNREMKNAEIDVSNGSFQVVPSVPGRSINPDEIVAFAEENARSWALAGGPVQSDVPVVVHEPELTTEGLGTTLFVNRSKRRVWVYQNGDAEVTSFPIAVGSSSYPTPRGWYEVTLHRDHPTWINPDPTGWGAGLPKKIGPGKSNPLGRYAINISAAGIRFHEGPNVGAAASHGCMRMHYSDVKKLATYAPVGTRVVIV